MHFTDFRFERYVLFVCLCFYTAVSANIIDYPVHSSRWTDAYDRHFRKYSKRYFGPLFDWHWFKAQAIAESGLDENARSHVGAVGIMQIMPATFEEITDTNPHFAELQSPRWNIAAGIYYDRLMYRKYPESAEQDRLFLALASYNAGYGRILNAQKKLGTKAITWEDAKKYLPGETRAYVHRIRRLMGQVS